MSASLIARLVAAGTPADLIGEVAMALGRAEADQVAIAARREADRVRKEKQRCHVTSQGVTGSHVTSRDQEDAPAPAPSQANPLVSKQEILPKEPPLRGVPKGKVSAKPRSRILTDAQPTDRDKQISNEFGLDQPTFRHEWTKFRAHHVSDGTTMANWSEAWRKWLCGWVDRGRKPLNGHANGARAGPHDHNEILDTTTRALVKIAAEFSH